MLGEVRSAVFAGLQSTAELELSSKRINYKNNLDECSDLVNEERGEQDACVLVVTERGQQDAGCVLSAERRGMVQG